MNYRLIIFDVDGTLVTTKSGETFRKTADDWQWLPGRLEICQKYVGASIALVTNQGGVAFGYLNEGAMDWELNKTANAIAPYVPCFRCYTHPEASLAQYRKEDTRRKPGPGMILEAMEYFKGVGPHNTLMVGDRPEDEQAAQNAGVAFMWADKFFKE